MSSVYRHGVYARQLPTSIVPPRRVGAALPVVVGAAPVHLIADDALGPVNQPVLIYSYSEAVQTLGPVEVDWSAYTLAEHLYSQFVLFKTAPCVCVNVFDPAVHKTAVVEEAKALVAGRLTLDHPGLVAAPTVTLSDGTACAAGDDYTVNRIAGTITRVATSAVIESDTAALKVSYEYGDPGKVTADDIVGGIDAASGAKSGLELVDQVFPRFGMIPGLILAPGWSGDPLVAAVMSTKAANINGHFRAMAVVDIPCDAAGVTKYSDASAWKALNNYADNTMVVCWPLVKLQGKVFHLSTQAAGIMAQVDYANDDVPHESPSNKPLECNGAQLADGTAVWLGPDEANYLNSQGITTANNFNGVWRLWGNRTGAYPAVTDVKDAFTCIQRMFNWLGNEFILTFWQKVDKPLTRRLIETIVDSYNIRLNGLAARQFILGGRVEFLPEENPFTDLMDGVVNFHLYVTPPSPARDITALIEYDPGYLSTLFS